MIADIVHGHYDLADWFLLFTIVAFALALAADVLAGRGVRPLALAGFALLALALFVL